MCPICSASVEISENDYGKLKGYLEALKKTLSGNNSNTKQGS